MWQINCPKQRSTEQQKAGEVGRREVNRNPYQSKQVPNGTAGKDDLQTRLDNIVSVTSPEVNDVDSNGVLDSDQLSEADQAVTNAEQANSSGYEVI
ncbi:GA-like domain-containing protein [Staphylococcus ureilyticus]|uniref:GA-like domain-containing protein n=1 Tax=Staphylococcus ureilyticus TaxID=94138 RepID=UPI0034DD772F